MPDDLMTSRGALVDVLRAKVRVGHEAAEVVADALRETLDRLTRANGLRTLRIVSTDGVVSV